MPFQKTLVGRAVPPSMVVCGEGAHEGPALAPRHVATCSTSSASQALIRPASEERFCLNELSSCWFCYKSNLLKRRPEDQVLPSCDILYICCLLRSDTESKDDSIASIIGRINAAMSLYLRHSLHMHRGAYVWMWCK